MHGAALVHSNSIVPSGTKQLTTVGGSNNGTPCYSIENIPDLVLCNMIILTVGDHAVLEYINVLFVDSKIFRTINVLLI